MTSRKETLLSAASGEELPRTHRALRILVADDDHDSALTLLMLLREEGHDATAVHSGRKVLSAIIQADPDVVILDINMPDMSGWQVAQTILARRTRAPLLIGISGVFTKGPDKILGRISGFDHYLVKPYAPEDLLKLLEPLRNQRQTLLGPT